MRLGTAVKGRSRLVGMEIKDGESLLGLKVDMQVARAWRCVVIALEELHLAKPTCDHTGDLLVRRELHAVTFVC